MGKTTLSTLSGFPFAPQMIVPCLSTLAPLKSSSLGFQHHRPRALQASQRQPPLARVAFHNLTVLGFRGDIEYLDDILCQIKILILNKSIFRFLNQLVLDTSLFWHFIRNTETCMTIHRERVEVSSWDVAVTPPRREEMAHNDREATRLEITCKLLDW